MSHETRVFRSQVEQTTKSFPPNASEEDQIGSTLRERGRANLFRLRLERTTKYDPPTAAPGCQIVWKAALDPFSLLLSYYSRYILILSEPVIEL